MKRSRSEIRNSAPDPDALSSLLRKASRIVLNYPRVESDHCRDAMFKLARSLAIITNKNHDILLPESKVLAFISEYNNGLTKSLDEDEVRTIVARAIKSADSDSDEEEDEENKTPMLKSQDYSLVAEAAIKHFSDAFGRPLYRRHCSVTYGWRNNKYSPLGKEEDEAFIAEWCEQRYTHVQGPHISVTNAFNRKLLLSDSAKAPCWIGSVATDFTRKFPPRECIALSNGILHLPSLDLLDPSPEFFNQSSHEFAFNPAIKLDSKGELLIPDELMPKKWLGFLECLFGDDQESIDALQEFFGLSVSSITRFQKLLTIVGPPGSGKGTIARVLMHIAGIPNTRTMTLSNLGGQFGLENLIGANLCIVPEITEVGKDLLHALGPVLAIIGEDDLIIQRKGTTSIFGGLLTRFLFLCNEAPKLHDPSNAYGRRSIVLQLKKIFRDKDALKDEDLIAGEANSNLTDELLLEKDKIFAWALQGLHRLLKRGYFIQPESGNETKNLMRDSGSRVGSFAREYCHVGDGFFVPKQVMHERYKLHCKEHNEVCPTYNKFVSELKSAVPTINPDFRPQVSFNGVARVRAIGGITLRREPELCKNPHLVADARLLASEPKYRSLLAFMVSSECEKFPVPPNEPRNYGLSKPLSEEVSIY